MCRFSKSLLLIICNILILFFVLSNAYSQQLLFEDFNDQSVDSRLTPRKVGTLTAISPPEYSFGVGRGGTGYSYGSGTLSDPYLEWQSANMPSPWPSNEMYVSYWMIYPTFTSSDPNENFKFFYPHWDGTNSYVVYSMVDNNTVYYSAKGQGTMLSSGNYLNCPNMANGQWHHYQFYVNFAQGISRFWYDGQLTLNHNYGTGVWTNNLYYIAAPCQDSEEDGIFTRFVDDWEVWDSMPDSSGDSSSDDSGDSSSGDSSSDTGDTSPSIQLSLVSWSANSQTGYSTWSDSSVVWCARILVQGDSIQIDGDKAVLSFRGRNSGSYAIRKVSIAEKDESAQDGNIIDATWTKITFNSGTESTWSTDSITVTAGHVKRSNPVPFTIERGKSYYVTFMMESPSTYLMAPSGYSELYFEGEDHSEDLDWAGNGHGLYAGRLHALETIGVQ